MRVASLFAVAAFSFASAAAVVGYIGSMGGFVGAFIDEDTPPVQQPTTLMGQMLVAAPDMSDPTFAGTRIYLVHHDNDGAVGVVVNGPVFGEAYGVPYGWGGPVGRNSVIVVHDGDVGGGVVVEDAVVVAGHDPDLMKALIHKRGPAHARTFVGYAGWGPGQLEHELRAGAWSVVDVSSVELFSN